MCTADGCDRPPTVRGLCKRHYMRDYMREYNGAGTKLRERHRNAMGVVGEVPEAARWALLDYVIGRGSPLVEQAFLTRAA